MLAISLIEPLKEKKALYTNNVSLFASKLRNILIHRTRKTGHRLRFAQEKNIVVKLYSNSL